MTNIYVSPTAESRVKIWPLKYTVKSVLSGHLKKDKTKILMTYGSLMKVKSIAECSPWSILQYFWPERDNWSWKPIFGLLFEWLLKTGFTVCKPPPRTPVASGAVNFKVVILLLLGSVFVAAPTVFGPFVCLRWCFTSKSTLFSVMSGCFLTWFLFDLILYQFSYYVGMGLPGLNQY